MVDYFETPETRRIAYNQTSGTGPGMVFLGNYIPK